MSQFMYMLAFALSFATGAGARAADVATTLNDQILISSLATVSPADLIDWKVGDRMDYKISAQGMPSVGTLVKEVTSDEGEAIWFRQTISLIGRTEVIDILIRKSDAKVLKVVRNGREEQIPDDKPEIISSEYADVTVPAGKFRCLYVIAKTKQVERLESWINPSDTATDGVLKQVMPTGFVTLTFELTSFKRN